MYRPLSPHLQIYRLPFDALLSISHRLSGLVLSLGAVFLVYVLYAGARGPESFRTVHALLGAWPGRLFLFVVSYAFLFHLCTGVRHLLWDAGWGLDLRAAERSGWVAVAAAGLLTALLWGLALWH